MQIYDTEQPLTSRPLLSPFSSLIIVCFLIILTGAVVLMFNRYPDIDRTVSGWFFSEQTCPADSLKSVCGYFPAAQNPILDGLRDLFHYLPIVVAVGLIISAIHINRNAPGKKLTDFVIGAYVAVAGLIVSALFIVNLWLKTHSGRPRPLQTDLFGGDLPFIPAGTFSEFCERNCSFVSGESAGGFWLVCLVALVPHRLQLPAFIVTISIACFIAGLRVSFGAHYLSDVTISGLLTLSVFSILAFVTARLITRRSNAL